MKKRIKQATKELLQLSEDREMFSIYILMLIFAMVNIIYIFVVLRPSELQLVSHYTAFGTTHLYRASWIDQSKTIFISITVLVFHFLLSRTISEKISRPLAKLVAWSGVIILIFIFINSSLIINVWSPK